MLPNKKHPIRYRVSPGETLASIARRFPHLPNWKILAEYNQLEYPYIVDSAFQKEAKAVGEVTFTAKSPLLNPIVIPIGTLVSTSHTGTANYVYRTTQEVTFSLTDQEKTVVVEALHSGSQYNILPQQIDTILSSPLNQFFNVRNDLAFSGGFHKKVVSYGETILIPGVRSEPPVTLDERKRYGTDLFTYDNLHPQFGELEADQMGDLKCVSGLDNLRQSLIRRVITELGSLPAHPEYGTSLLSLVGQASFHGLPELLGYEVIRTLKQHPIVSDVRNVQIDIDRDAATITCQVVIDDDVTIPLQAVIP